MNREATWGTAAVITILAAIGISTHPGNRIGDGDSHEGGARKGYPVSLSKTQDLKPGVCTDLENLFRAFLATDRNNFTAPDSCYATQAARKQNAESELRAKTLHLTFVIATVPDPLHTHFALLFDRFTEAIEQAAQDEGYAYDSSWLPWETEEQTFTHLSDQDEADDRKESREDQPGVILFRKDKAALGFEDGLAVFIVGEEATRGIHRWQFENAVDWISKLGGSAISILGPSFSGSFQSLAQLLSSDAVHRSLHYSAHERATSVLHIYSGSTTSDAAVKRFIEISEADQKLKNWGISFHSFVAGDDEVLADYCSYLNHTSQEGSVAFISEDETAYGSYNQTPKTDKTKCPHELRLYYPRDISALRAAYQSQSIFSAESSQTAERPRKNLPSNLADPANQVHDTIPSFAGVQTPLSEESVLLGIVGQLKAHRSEYLVLRCSNTLDPLFLSEFFRRMYPQGRAVIVGADLLFLRERGTTGISGITMLSNYPLLPLEQDWTKWGGPASLQNASITHIHRVFGEDSVEGTYTAARFLMYPFTAQQLKSLDDPDAVFLPPNPAPARFDPPDYAAPSWLAEEKCKTAIAESAGADPTQDRKIGSPCEQYLRPVVWLSVLGRDSFYPVGAFIKGGNETSAPLAAMNDQLPKIPLSMIYCWLAVLVLAVFHAACCQWPSFTVKPAFRAYFASATHCCGLSPTRHRVFIAIGSAFAATAGLVCALGCGAFSKIPLPFLHRYWTMTCFLVIVLIAFLGIIANHAAAIRFKNDEIPVGLGDSWSDKLRAEWLRWYAVLPVLVFLLLMILSYEFYARTLEDALTPISRIPAYWRSMNITSEVSPIVPFLCLLGGLYLWFWYSLHGLALFGPDRPRLPLRSELQLRDHIGKANVEGKKSSEQHVVLRMFSQEDAADITEQLALPGSWGSVILAAIIFSAILGLLWKFGTPIRSLGATGYGRVFCCWLGLCFSLMLAEAWQLLRTWSSLRQLLVFLDRLPLRRTLQALRGFSWGSIWKMSGNVLEVRYKLLSRQAESLNHLLRTIDDLQYRVSGQETPPANNCVTAANHTHDVLQHFAFWYSEKYLDPNAGNLQLLQNFQISVATLAGNLLTTVLVPAWHKEAHSLILELSDSERGSASNSISLPLTDLPAHVRNSEELVCLPYLGFVQNILGRIRTLVLGIICIFVSATLALAFYPFDPRNLIGEVMIFLFIVLGTVICYVYADMHRDATLSHITNTNPGELGIDFWFKLIGLGLGPLLGLLATVFPGIADFLFSWVEPSLASLR